MLHSHEINGDLTTSQVLALYLQYDTAKKSLMRFLQEGNGLYRMQLIERRKYLKIPNQ